MNLKKLCSPRKSVFNKDRRDVVLDLSDLLDSKTKADSFFDENFITSGMKTLIEKTFRRLEGLRVLTQYSDIEGHDIRHELFRQRESGEKTAFELVIDRAVEIASDHLVPAGLDRQSWKSLSSPERLYLKGLELEKHMEARSGAYQELAKGFGVRDYTLLFASTKANEVRFKTGSEFKKSNLSGTGFAGSLTRNILFAIHETVESEDARQGLNWFHTEVPDYWNQRKLIMEILKYISCAAHPHMPHWAKDTDAAQRLAGAVENDHGGRI